MASMNGSAANGAAAALERSWRKVASTHNLQALSDEAADGAPQRRQSILTGVLLLLVSTFVLVAATLFLLVFKVIPSSSNSVLAAIQRDWYYCFLLPLTAPMTVLAVALNWFSLKLFKHNS